MELVSQDIGSSRVLVWMDLGTWHYLKDIPDLESFAQRLEAFKFALQERSKSETEAV